MLRMKLNHLILAAAFVGLSALAPAQAAFYENTLPPGGSGSVGSMTTVPNSTSATSMIYESFSTGLTKALADVELELSVGTATGSVIITLYQDVSGNSTISAPAASPITVLATISDTALFNAFSSDSGVGFVNVVNVLSDYGNTLKANSAYWIGIQTVGVTGLGTAGKVKIGEETVVDQGTSKEYLTALSTSPLLDLCTASDTTSCPGFVSANDAGIPVYNAQAPEPASLAVLGSALTGLGMIRRRRAKRAAAAAIKD